MGAQGVPPEPPCRHVQVDHSPLRRRRIMRTCCFAGDGGALSLVIFSMLTHTCTHRYTSFLRCRSFVLVNICDC